MRVLIGLALCFFGSQVFAQTSNDKLIKTCVNGPENIEMFVYQRLDFFGRPIQSHVKDRDLYRVEVIKNGISVFETDYALFSEQNSEFYSARGMALMLNYANTGRLYLANRDRYGRLIGPAYNTLKVNCRDY